MDTHSLCSSRWEVRIVRVELLRVALDHLLLLLFRLELLGKSLSGGDPVDFCQFPDIPYGMKG